MDLERRLFAHSCANIVKLVKSPRTALALGRPLPVTSCLPFTRQKRSYQLFGIATLQIAQVSRNRTTFLDASAAELDLKFSTVILDKLSGGGSKLGYVKTRQAVRLSCALCHVSCLHIDQAIGWTVHSIYGQHSIWSRINLEQKF